MFRKTLLFTAAGLLAMAPLGAQRASDVSFNGPQRSLQVTPDWQQGLKFRLVGPSRGGRVTTVTGVPSQPRTFYMGVASGGLFRTTDGGANWAPITDGKVPLGSTGSVAVADSDPNVIYLGTGSDDVRSNVSTGRGIYKTTDGGETWKFVRSRTTPARSAACAFIRPIRTSSWVAAQGDAFKNNPERGIFKTTDGGATWKKTLFISDTVGAMDVELQPGNPERRLRVDVAPRAQAVDDHQRRRERRRGLLQEHRRRRALHEDHRRACRASSIGKGNIGGDARPNPNRVYALVEAKPGGGLYRSDDAGADVDMATPARRPQMI